MSPLPSTFSTASFPSTDAALIFTEQAGPGLALGEYICAALHRLRDDAGAQTIDMLRSELSEQAIISQDRAFIDAAPQRAIFMR
jgi:hypothetical protein